MNLDEFNFTEVTEFRMDLTDLSTCLLSYQVELIYLKDQLAKSSSPSTDFAYEIPSLSLRKFDSDDDYLSSMSTDYIASLLTKFELSRALDANGSDVQINADRLYTDVDTSLFSDASELIDAWDDYMSSFYMGLVQQVNVIQVYMYHPDDKELERFLRHLSVWRMLIVNFQKSQVLLFFVVVSLHAAVLSWNSTRPFSSQHPPDILARMSGGCCEENGPGLSK